MDGEDGYIYPEHNWVTESLKLFHLNKDFSLHVVYKKHSLMNFFR